MSQNKTALACRKQEQSANTTRNLTVADAPPLSKWKEYEVHKRYLQAAGLTPWEYEIEVGRLAERLEI